MLLRQKACLKFDYTAFRRIILTPSQVIIYTNREKYELILANTSYQLNEDRLILLTHSSPQQNELVINIKYLKQEDREKLFSSIHPVSI